MITILSSVDARLPAHTVYQQWTQLERLPGLMRSVEDVRQVSRHVTHWRVCIAGISREWDAEIREQTQDQSMAWRTIRGPRHSGTVTFKPLSTRNTRVTLLVNFDPQGLLEKAAARLGLVEMSLGSNLRHFKHMIESGNHAGGPQGNGNEVHQGTGRMLH